MQISDEAIKGASINDGEQSTEKPAKAPRAPKAPKAAPESEAPAEKPAKARKAAKAEPAPEATPEPAKARKGRKVPVAEASPTETPAEAAMRVTDEAAPATEPAKVRRLRGFVPRDPTVVCVIGLDTTHTARIASDEHPDAHPLYDERAHDEVSEADVDGADAVGESHDPVKIVRTIIAANTITPSYARVLAAQNDDIKIDKRGRITWPEAVEVEATVDGRHRVGAYRETNARRVRAGLDAVELRCELLKGLDDVRLLELRIATNNLRREDTTLGKARLARDLMDLKRVAYKERGEEAPAKHTMYKEIAPYFRVSDVAIRQWCDVLTRHPDVLAAVEAGTLSLTSAYKDFRGVPAEEQPAKLARILAGETRTAAASGDDFGGDAGSAPPGGDDSGGGDGEGSGEGDGSGDGDGDGDGTGVSAREDGGWKPDKRALNKVIAAQESKEIELPPHFVLGIRFALGHEINEAGVKGLKAALRDLKLRAD